jgi:error-prone DNA polymerase
VLLDLSDDRPRKHVTPTGPAPIEPLNDDRRDHPEDPAKKLRHPRNVRILLPSRDFL